MIINNTYIEEELNSLLQKKINFELEGKLIKSGKLILFSQKYYYISLILNTLKKKREKLEIPIPFNIEIDKEDNVLYFDYRISTLAKNNKQAFDLINNIPTQKNKFLNKILSLYYFNE